jgi:4-hydroxy-tetrahydrodipicolinate synthase
VRVAPEDVARLAEAGAVVGIKDSSRDFEYFLQVLDVTSHVPGFQAFTGSDSLLLASLLAGGAGAITLGANIAPAWLVQVCDFVHRGQWVEAREPQRHLLRLIQALRTGVFPSAAKAALELLGVCGGSPAPPAAPLADDARAHLASTLRGLGLLPRAAMEHAA